MKSRAVWFLASVVLFALSASGAARSEKAQVVIRTEVTGSWQMFVFGPSCPGKMEVLPQTDPTEPIEVRCKL